MLIMTIMINYYYNFNKTKSVFNNFEKVIKINIKKNIDLDKSTRKIYLIFNVRLSVTLIEIEKNINFIYLYS